VNDNGSANNIIPQNHRITIKHVAHQAGITTQTVSRVINGHPDVAPETRQRILDIIEQLDYQPSEHARSLIQRRSYTLGVVTAGLKYIGPNRTLNGITTKAEEFGYALSLEELPAFSVENVQPIIQSLLGRHVDGILWAVEELVSKIEAAYRNEIMEPLNILLMPKLIVRESSIRA
jgi:DNA-binding LacI/PurR family transcriptional regulator